MAEVKILLVEDDAIEAMDIKRTMESFGYSVPHVASSGEEAVEKALKIMPDIILMDIILKGDSNGIEAASKIKRLNIPVIFLTAHSEESTIQKAKLTEPYGYIIKPFDSTELKYAIELALYKNKLENKLKDSEKRFRHILENSLDASYRRNLETDKYDYLSPVIKQVLGYSVEEFISMPSTSVVELIHPDDRENVDNIFANAFSEKTKTYNIEYRFKQKDGHYKWVNDFGSIVQDDNIMFLIGSVRDITERKKAENKIKKSLEEKEILIQELHHRVKNNLQIIASLLHLQEVSVDEEETVDVLKESEGRVKSIAMVHEKLYQSPSFTEIIFKQYVEKLVSDIFYTYGIPSGTIKSKLIIKDINLNIDTAIPLGLIINELVTNSVKYAFPKSAGTITIQIKRLHERMALTITDNGIGIPENVDIQNPETLGLQLVNNLLGQIDGEIKLNRIHGTEIIITFKELNYQERVDL